MPVTSTSNFREQMMERCGGFPFVFLKGLCGEAGEAENLNLHFENFEEKDFGHIGYLKRKAFQLYVDEMRKQDSRPVVQCYEDLPENSALNHPKEPSNSMEELRFYEEFWRQFESFNLNKPDTSFGAAPLLTKDRHFVRRWRSKMVGETGFEPSIESLLAFIV